MNVDFIIVGAGSAGCVLANRLSVNGQHSVLLLEAGVSDRSLTVQMPLGYALAFNNPKLNWMYQTAAEPALNDRSCFWPRGKVLGGSSSINAMVYMRGLPSDYDAWQAQGNPGWAWADVLPLFKRSEDHQLGENAHHNEGGELHVSDVADQVHPLVEKFIAAGKAAGYPHTPDFNGDQKEGVGLYQINARDGYRASSANAFLKPIKRRRNNLQVITQAHVSRVLFDVAAKDSPPRATGVEFIKGQTKTQVTANKEVILCGGAVNSPQLLQLSGVGDPETLSRAGVELRHELKAVGQHLQDHLCHTHYYKSKVPTLNNDLYPLWGKFKVALKYALSRKGVLAMSVNQAGGLVRSSPSQPLPDLQLYFNPLTYALNGVQRKVLNTDPFAAFSMTVNACRPSSRGAVLIDCADPFAQPVIQPNYLSTDKDIKDIIAGNHLLRKIAGSSPLAELIEHEISPGPAVQTDAQLLDAVRAQAGTIYHPCGSCKMGTDAGDAVVDARLRVHGITNLRVIDASIFPAITSANTNAPSIMVGEKGAQMLLEDHI